MGNIDSRSRRSGFGKNSDVDSSIDFLPNVDSKGSKHQECEVLLTCVNKKSQYTAGKMHVSKVDIDVDAGAQGIVIECVSGETKETTPP